MSTGKQDFGTTAARTLLTTQLDSLADGSYSSAGTAVDFGDPAPFGVVAEAKITGTSGGTGPVLLFMLWSADNTDFSDQAANEQNGELIGVVDLLEATETIKVWSFNVTARYGKMMAYNDSGAALASNAGDIVGTDAQVDIT